MLHLPVFDEEDDEGEKEEAVVVLEVVGAPVDAISVVVAELVAFCAKPVPALDTGLLLRLLGFTLGCDLLVEGFLI